MIKMPKDKKVYVIGMAGLEEELREEGITYIGGTVGNEYVHLHETHPTQLTQLPLYIQDPADNSLENFSLKNWTPDPTVGAVLCGLDTSINYTKLSKAFNYLLRNEGCEFLVTNEDSTYPTAEGLLPGAGSVSAPLRFALGRDPVAIGKPKSTMLDCIKAK